MCDTPTFGRYAELPFGKMTPEQRAGYRAMMAAQAAPPAANAEPNAGGPPTSLDDPREQVVHEMAMVLPQARWVPRGLHERAVKALGHVGITDVITLMGHYSSVAMTLAFYDVPDGATGMAR